MAAKKAPKGSQTKVESITIRVSPKIKWGVELLSRKQRRSVTSVVEWALDQILNNPDEGLIVCEHDESVNILEATWDPLPHERFIKLVLGYPSLLTYEEELLWRLIQIIPDFWDLPDNQMRKVREEAHSSYFVKTHLDFGLVGTFWTDLNDVIEGKLNRQELDNMIFQQVSHIEYQKQSRQASSKPKPQPVSSNLLTEDDIPF